MKRGLMALAAAVGVVIATPAHADFQQTQWGMTPEQVAKAMNGSAPLGQGTPGERIEKPNEKIEIGNVGGFRLRDRTFRSVYYYKNNALWMVSLKLPGKSGCGSLPDELLKSLGDPFYDRTSGSNRYIVWQMERNGDLIRLADSYGSCSIRFYELESARGVYK